MTEALDACPRQPVSPDRPRQAEPPQFRVHIVDNARVVSEDALSLRASDRVGRTRRPTCTVLLPGSARISAFREHRWLGAGAGLVVAHKQAICMRQEGERYRAVAVATDAPDRRRQTRPRRRRSRHPQLFRR